uniref:Peptidase M11 gametolysin domain-containing protein n=1 Tax=Chaetoceros debilis TaxID=122233 RepID=A0A7S3VCI6_9STRA
MKISVAALILALGLIPGEAEAGHNHHDSNHHLQAVGEEKCTVFIEDRLYDDRDETAPPKDKRSRLSCFMSDGRSYTIPFADADYIKENFESGLYESGKTELILGPGAMIDPSTNELVVSSAGAEFRPKESSGRRKLTSGTKTILVVRVVASNAQTTASQAELSDSVFGTSGDTITLSERYKSCSHGKLTFNAATGSNISAGTTQVTVSSSTTDGDDTMGNDITLALNALFGVSSPDQIADHVMYCFPKNTIADGGIAYASFGGWISVYDDDWCTYPSVGVHEIGHNLVLAHSNDDEGNEYGDQSGAMGYSFPSGNSPEYCFNAAKLYTLGWFSARSKTISTSGTTSYSGNIADLTQDPDAAGSPILFFLDGTTDYYLNYNRATGINSGTISGPDQVRIVQNGGTQQSILQASLAAGGTWTSPAVFGGSTVTVVVNSIGTEANINISIAGAPVTAPITAPVTAPVMAPVSTPTGPVVPPVTAPVMAPPTPTPPSPSPPSCVNDPIDWNDSGGAEYDCDWYAGEADNCAIYGDDFANDEFENDTAKKACCVCGGGSSTGPSPGPPSPGPGPGPSPCPAGEKLFEIEVITDLWGKQDNKFRVQEKIGNKFKNFWAENDFENETVHSFQKCLSADDTCYKFIMIDAAGDGLCCEDGQGGYKLTQGGEVIRDSKFRNGTKQRTNFNC